MSSYALTVIIPTYNEMENIENMIWTIIDVFQQNSIYGEILVVDDMSTDGSIQIVQELQKHQSDIHLIVREHDHGLSQSVVEGFERAQSDIIQVVDADFSHPVELIPAFYHAIHDEGYDVCIGSRYIKGGNILDWPLKRKLISRGATIIGKFLFPEITDPVSGFFAIKKEVVQNSILKPRGYKILMEVLGKGQWESVTEIPFTFKDRELGKSKLDTSTITDYLRQCLDIAVYALKNHNTVVWNEWMKILKFGLVGLSGIGVNTGILYLLTECAGWYYLASSIFAIEGSIITNFILNDAWTFTQGKNRLSEKWRRFISFQIVSLVGVAINMSILFLLTEVGNLWYIVSNFIGIFVAFLWNYWINRTVTWGKQR